MVRTIVRTIYSFEMSRSFLIVEIYNELSQYLFVNYLVKQMFTFAYRTKVKNELIANILSDKKIIFFVRMLFYPTKLIEYIFFVLSRLVSNESIRENCPVIKRQQLNKHLLKICTLS